MVASIVGAPVFGHGAIVHMVVALDHQVFAIFGSWLVDMHDAILVDAIVNRGLYCLGHCQAVSFFVPLTRNAGFSLRAIVAFLPMPNVAISFWRNSPRFKDAAIRLAGARIVQQHPKQVSWNRALAVQFALVSALKQFDSHFLHTLIVKQLAVLTQGPRGEIRLVI